MIMGVRVLTAAAAGALLAAAPALADTTATAITELNIRSGPGPHHAVIGVIPTEASVAVRGCLEEANWCHVEHAGIEGWAYGVYLTAEEFEATAEAEPPAAIIERRTEINVPVVTYQDTSGTGAAIGAAGGAATGAVLGGPVGAAIGYAAGGLLGGLTSVPDPVVSYVREHRTETVYLDGEVVVGGTIPEDVELVEVPDTEFRYVYVNEVPAVVEPDSRRIVRIVRCAPSTRSIGGCTTCLFQPGTAHPTANHRVATR
jgi:uncharacterized protein YraI